MDIEIYDTDTFDGLSTLIDDKMSELRAENDPEKQLKHLAVVKEAVNIRRNISVYDEAQQEQQEKQSWIDTPTDTKTFICDCIKGISIPLFGFLGVIAGSKIQANSAERIADKNNLARRELLEEVKRSEQEDIISKHSLDIVNGIK